MRRGFDSGDDDDSLFVCLFIASISMYDGTLNVNYRPGGVGINKPHPYSVLSLPKMDPAGPPGGTQTM